MTQILAISTYLPVTLGLLTREEAIVNDFDVRGITGTVEGPQMVIEWSPPLSPSLVSEIKLVRKQGGAPSSPDDGVTVFTATTPVEAVDHYVDFDVESCEGYFYRMYSQRAADGIWFDGEFDDDLVASPAFHGHWIYWEEMPELYRKADRRTQYADQKMLPLQKQQDATPGYYDYVNLTEPEDDTGIRRGQLERFLRVVGAPLDVVKSHIDCYPAVIDVDRAPSRYLPNLATKIGLDLNREFDPIKQREEIKGHIPNIKIKGSDESIEGKIRSIVGGTPTLHWWQRNVLISGREDRVSCNLDDPDDVVKMGSAEDPYYYSLGGPPDSHFNPNSLTLFLDWDGTTPITEALLGKIQRVLPDFVPATLLVDVVVRDTTEETYGASSRVTETWSDATNP
jgi:phage tail-like protein